MPFEEMPKAEQPKSLLDALKAEIAAAEEDLKGHYKKKDESDGYGTYKEGKEKSTDLLALRKAAKTLEEAGGDADAAIASLEAQMKQKELVANPEVYMRAAELLERRSQAN